VAVLDYGVEAGAVVDRRRVNQKRGRFGHGGRWCWVHEQCQSLAVVW
jgi:hypothetical protein